MSLPLGPGRMITLVKNDTAVQPCASAKRVKRKAESREPRKHSYTRRKEELDNLTAEAEELSSRVASMRRRHDSKPDPEILGVMDRNTQLKQLLHQQRYSLWRVSNTVSDWLKTPAMNPLAKFIHLTGDKEQRRKELLVLQDFKTAEARHFLTERSMVYDLLQPYSTEDRFVTADGDSLCTRFDITQFEDVKSVKQVHEALLFYISNIDTTISQELGHITLCEDYDRLANRILHQRLVSCDHNGVMHEANVVVFSQFTDCGDPDESFGIVATDFVDVDDLFPYRPDTSVRKDIVGAIMLTAIRKPKGSMCNRSPVSTESIKVFGFEGDEPLEEEGELVVVMRRASYNTLRHSDLGMSAKELRDSRESIVSWTDVMVKAIRDRLEVINTQ